MSEHEAAFDYRCGTLDGKDRARFEAHLANCARCQAELADYDHLRDVAKAMMTDDVPSARLTGVLRAQLLREAASARRPKPTARRWVVATAAAGLFIGVGVFAVSRKGAAPAPVSAPARGANDGLDRARQRAGALARAGRCQEAVEAYAAIEQHAPARLDADDWAAYERCKEAMKKSRSAP